MALATSVICATALPAAAGQRDPSPYERDLAVLINQYRTRNALPELADDNTLRAIAREHSAAMAKDRRLSHHGMPARVRKSGWGMCVENVGWNYPSAADQFEGWRGSQGHKQNLLDRRVQRIGIGVVDGYVTQIACGK